MATQCYSMNGHSRGTSTTHVEHYQWRNRQGGQSAPETSDREISDDLLGKNRQEKREKG